MQPKGATSVSGEVNEPCSEDGSADETKSDGGDDNGAGLPHCISGLLCGDNMPYKRLVETLTELRGEAHLKLPTIVVCGAQGHGKSSTLERIAQREVFPRDSRICTRMVVRLMLRRSAKKETKMRVFDTEQCAGIMPAWIDIPEGSPLRDAITKKMNDFVNKTHEGQPRAIDGRHELQVMLRAPNVPTIDLVDLPSVVSTTSAAITEALTKRFLARRHTLVLAVISAADTSIEINPIWQLLRGNKNPAVVALTHMDLAQPAHQDLIAILSKDAELVPAGDSVQSVIPVVNRSTREKDKQVSLPGALAAETRALTAKLEEIGMSFDASQHGIRAVVGALDSMLHEYMANTWVRTELVKLGSELGPIIKALGKLDLASVGKTREEVSDVVKTSARSHPETGVRPARASVWWPARVVDANAVRRRELVRRVELVGEAADVLLGLMQTCPESEEVVAGIRKVMYASKSGRLTSDSICIFSERMEGSLRSLSAKNIEALLLSNSTDGPAHVNHRDDLAAQMLGRACGHGGVVNVLRLKGADMLAKSKDGGNTALILACTSGNEDVIKLLLNSGTDVLATNDEGDTALHIALMRGHEGVAKLLLDNGADVHAKNKSGRSPLEVASAYNYESVAKLLLDSSANVHGEDGKDCTLLHVACTSGHKVAAKLLLDHGADANAADGRWRTPLHLACQNGHKGVAKLLLSKGANVHASLDNGKTALHLACQNGHEGVAELLLNKGANLGAKDKFGCMVLHLACQNGHRGAAELLLNKGADVNATLDNGKTALHIVCREGQHERVVTFLLKKSADVTKEDELGYTVLHLACQNGHKGIAKLLLEEYNANVHAKTKSGETPLDLACWYGHGDVAKLLLDKKAKVHATLKDGKTALHIACRQGHEGIAKLLLDKKADVHAKLKDNKTALHLASLCGHEGVTKLLLDNRAEVHAKDDIGWTALDYACKNGHEGVAKLLRGSSLIDQLRAIVNANPRAFVVLFLLVVAAVALAATATADQHGVFHAAVGAVSARPHDQL